MTNTYAVLDTSNNVLNVIVWDGASPIDLATGQSTCPTPAADGSDAQIGGRFADGSFVAPPDTAEPLDPASQP